MNKLIKKIAAALLSAACIPVTGVTASAADVPWYWGTTSLGNLDGMERLNDHGAWTSADPKTEVYLYHDPSAQNYVVLITPRSNTLRLVLRDDVDIDEAGQKIAEVIDTYYPGILEHYDPKQHASYVGTRGEDDFIQLYVLDMGIPVSQEGRVFELHTNDNRADAEAGILLSLAKAHLLSEYYGWGRTADYEKGNLPYQSVLDWLYSTASIYNAEQEQTIHREIDWDAVQDYLTAHYPGLIAEANVKDDSYRITGAEDWSMREQLELLFELWEQFGVWSPVQFDYSESGQAPLTSRNALEQKGDVTLDTDISIVDVIALNRNIMTGDPLCDTAKQNADINGNGAPDETDSLDLLKYIVGINETLG